MEEDKIDGEQLTDELVADSIKRIWRVMGIEGCEDMFRQAYAHHPIILAKFQGVYDRLIGRSRK